MTQNPPPGDGRNPVRGSAGKPSSTARGPRLRVAAVTSGKGGVGKSNLVANLAVVAARSGRRVLVIDADLGLANVEILYGLKPTLHIGDLLAAGASLDQILVEGPSGVKLLPAGSGIHSLASLTDDQKLRIVHSLDAIEDRFDLVLIDTGAGIGPNVTFFAGAAQEALLVVGPEPTALFDAYVAVKVLSEDAGVSRFGVVVNPVTDPRAAREIFPKLSGVAGRFLKARLRLLGFIPRDDNVPRAVLRQRPVVDVFPSSPASRAISELAARWLGEDPGDGIEGGLKFMWRRLLREAQPAAVPPPAP